MLQFTGLFDSVQFFNSPRTFCLFYPSSKFRQFTVSPLCMGGDWWRFHSYKKHGVDKVFGNKFVESKVCIQSLFRQFFGLTQIQFPDLLPTSNWRPKLVAPAQNFKDKTKKERKKYRSQTLVNNNFRNYAWLLISSPPVAVSLLRFWRLPSRCRSSLKLIGFGAVIVFTKSA